MRNFTGGEKRRFESPQHLRAGAGQERTRKEKNKKGRSANDRTFRSRGFETRGYGKIYSPTASTGVKIRAGHALPLQADTGMRYPSFIFVIPLNCGVSPDKYSHCAMKDIRLLVFV